MNISTAKYTILVSLYSLPCIFTSFFAGLLADIFGRRRALILCGSFILAGQLFLSIGISYRSFNLAAMGRFIYGMGSEPHSGKLLLYNIVVSLETLSHWNFMFLPISLGIFSATKKLGGGINSLLTPHIYGITNDLRVVFLIGLCAATICLAADIIFAVFEQRVTKSQEQSASNSASNSIRFSDIFHFKKIFWLLIIHIGLFFGIFMSFLITASGMTQTRFHFTVAEAGLSLVLLLLSIVYFALSPYHRKHLFRLYSELR